MRHDINAAEVAACSKMVLTVAKKATVASSVFADRLHLGELGGRCLLGSLDWLVENLVKSRVNSQVVFEGNDVSSYRTG